MTKSKGKKLERKLIREFPIYSDDDIVIIQEWQNFKEIKTVAPPFKLFIPSLPIFLIKNSNEKVFKEKGSNYYLIGNKKYLEK